MFYVDVILRRRRSIDCEFVVLLRVSGNLGLKRNSFSLIGIAMVFQSLALSGIRASHLDELVSILDALKSLEFKGGQPQGSPAKELPDRTI